MTQAHPTLKPLSAPATQPAGLAALRRQIALLEKLSQAGMGGPATTRALTWGLNAIDLHLPGGGLALGALHEFAGHGPDLEEASLAAAAVARLMGRRQQHGNGSTLWIARQRDLYARALPERGVDPDRLLHLRIKRNADALWAMEEALRCAGLNAVVAEISALDLTQSRRLQLAAEKSGIPALVIRRGGRADQLRHLGSQPIAAVTRWRIGPAPSLGIEALPHPALPGAPRWQIELWRCRGGRPGTWLIEEHEDGWREATIPQPVSGALADRPLVAPAPSAAEPGIKRAAG
ncbi:ImuA family protein [Dongia mobilis]|jgi:protein ImuA|uniref:ImuA family protein n=1 Tax=Dongia sp. TaxID=1977262 RepID=UPI0026EC9505